LVDAQGRLRRDVHPAKVVQHGHPELACQEGRELRAAHVAGGLEELSQRGGFEVALGERSTQLFLSDAAFLDQELTDALDLAGWHVVGDYRSTGAFIKATSE